MKHAGGRPIGSTKYNPLLSEKLEAYIDDCREKRIIPWIEEFCSNNRVSRRTFYYWVKKYDELRFSRDRLMDMQRLILIQLGLSMKGNSRIIIFILKRNHGMRETKPAPPRQETTVMFC
ncbi:hypothetical protein A3A56_03865 [Candidatus Roizmanbacteria bacterium RIFCSPLOWO2_01_FULL_40_32]|nr:MAG: hypothetical protein A3A56_03865 [Candidatus Roizmanbacteria bacterium RIFCSPLOWO2_01_FULL_40_32]